MTTTMNAATDNRHSRGADVQYTPWLEAVRVDARVGSLVVLDGGRRFGERLLPGDPEPFGRGLPGCDFRYPHPVEKWREAHAIACNIHVTGRISRHGSRIGQYDGWWVRVQIEWVGDCEPSQFCTGYMRLEL